MPKNTGEMASPSATTIDIVGEDLLQSILTKLPAVDFASAACVSRTWKLVCDRVLSRPKLSCACSFNHSLQDAVEEVVNKVLSEPIRPHFAIASGGVMSDLYDVHQRITEKVGSKIPVITLEHLPSVEPDHGDDDDYDEGVMLIIGFLPGIKVQTIPLLKQVEAVGTTRCIDKFVTDIMEFSASVSGFDPSAIIMFSRDNDPDIVAVNAVIEKLDYALSDITAVVGPCGSFLRHASGTSMNITASQENASVVALVFAEDGNKPPGIGETQFHAVLSSGLLRKDPTYKVTSVKEQPDHQSQLAVTGRREGSHENLDGEAMLNQARRPDRQSAYIGVTKRRKYSIGQDEVRWMTSLTFHDVENDSDEGLIVSGVDIKAGDTFCFYRMDEDTAIYSDAHLFHYLNDLKQMRTIFGDKMEVFGGLIFRSSDRDDYFLGLPNGAPFLEVFPGVTLGRMFCSREIARGDWIPYIEESPGKKAGSCCVHVYSDAYLIMSYTPCKMD